MGIFLNVTRQQITINNLCLKKYLCKNICEEKFVFLSLLLAHSGNSRTQFTLKILVQRCSMSIIIEFHFISSTTSGPAVFANAEIVEICFKTLKNQDQHRQKLITKTAS